MKLSSLGARLLAPFKRPMRVFMSDDERVVLETAFGLLSAPPRVLEWGSGGSTVHFARRLPPGASWRAIEHQPAWAERVRQELSRLGIAGVVVDCVSPSQPHREGSGDGDEHGFREYVARAASHGAELDVVLVDGRARVACLREGFRRLRDGGFAALHDAQRAIYAEARPEGAHRVRVRDPRAQVDGADIELQLFFKREALADRLVTALEGKLHPAVQVTRD